MIFLRHAALDCRIYYKEARTLRDNGYDVHLLGRLTDGRFRDMGGREVGAPDDQGEWSYEGMTFHGVTKRKGLAGKYNEYQDLVKVGVTLNADIYHCHESDVALAAAISIKKALEQRPKIIFDSHEYWPGAYAYRLLGESYRLILPFFSRLEKFALKYFDAVIASDRPTAGLLQGYDLTRPVELIYNAPVIDDFSPADKSGKPSIDPSGRLALCHEGTLNLTRKITVLLDIIERMKSQCLLYVIGGIDAPDQATAARAERLREEGAVIDLGWVPYECVFEAMDPARVGLILLLNQPNLVTAAPNKLFNYMSRGIPVIADDYIGVRDIIARYKCGLLVDPGNTDNYLDAIRYLLDHPREAEEMGRNGKEAVSRELSWKAQGEKLLEIYDRLLSPKAFHTG